MPLFLTWELPLDFIEEVQVFMLKRRVVTVSIRNSRLNMFSVSDHFSNILLNLRGDLFRFYPCAGTLVLKGRGGSAGSIFMIKNGLHPMTFFIGPGYFKTGISCVPSAIQQI